MKTKNMKTAKSSVVAGGWGRTGINKWSTEGFQVGKTILYDAIFVDTCHSHLSKSVEYRTPRVNHNVNYGF